MSSAPKKQKAKSEKYTTTKEDTTSPVASDVVGETCPDHWTRRPDSLKILVDCAALLGISEKLDSESMGSSPDKLAMRAVALINACEISLKWETMQADERVREQLSKLQDMRSFRAHLSFEAGARALLQIEDKRRDRLDAGIERLLKLDFKLEPRIPRQPGKYRGEEEYRRLDIRPAGETPPAPGLEKFVAGELAWYHANGFEPEDLNRLSALKSKVPKVTG